MTYYQLVTMSSLSCISHVKRNESTERPPAPTLYTDVCWCGDRSGSMCSMGQAPMDGGKNFMKEHKENAKKMKNVIGYHVDFTSFDDEAETYYDDDASNIIEEDIKNAGEAMSPRGCTKFYDTAIGCISRQQKRVDAIKEKLTVEQKRLYYENSHLINVVFATFTDGYDNRSIADAAALKRAIQKHEDKYGAVCMFLAANISADKYGEQFGFQKNFCMQMGSDPVSSANALRTCSAAMTRAVTQGSQNSQFTPMERELSLNTNNHQNMFVTPPRVNRVSRNNNVMPILRQAAGPVSPITVPAVPFNTPLLNSATSISPITIPPLPLATS